MKKQSVGGWANMPMRLVNQFRWESVFIGCLLALWMGNVLRVGLFNPLGMWLYSVWFTPEASPAPISLANSLRIALQLPSAFAVIMMGIFASLLTASFYYLHFRFADRGLKWLRNQQRWILLSMLLLLVLLGRLGDLTLDSRIVSLIIPDFLQIGVTYLFFYAFWGIIEALRQRVENR